MARQPDIRYVQNYTYGSAARKLEAPEPKKKNKVALPKPKQRRERQQVLHIDPLSLGAIGAAGLLLVSLVIGMIHLGQAESRRQELENYVSQLQEENARLESQFREDYDPQQVQQQAGAQGMIPEDQAQRVPMELIIPEEAAQPGHWERIKTFFAELFA